jgi:ADP-heptose:LPS heptosyltransferase
LRGLPNLVHLGDDLRDFADTAAIISLLDVVISVDTAVAHLAGALGRPVMILLPYAADFRWMRDRDDSPWYPGAKLLRQPAFADWDSVIARAADELRRLALGFH